MNISEYFSLEFLFVILSVIFILALPGFLIKLARRSKTGFIISIAVVCLIIVASVVLFTVSYNSKYSLEGKNYVYGRITEINNSNHTFNINSTKGTYLYGSVGNIRVKIDSNTKVYDSNFFKTIKSVEVGDFVTVVCSNEQIENGVVNAIRVIRNH